MSHRFRFTDSQTRDLAGHLEHKFPKERVRAFLQVVERTVDGWRPSWALPDGDDKENRRHLEALRAHLLGAHRELKCLDGGWPFMLGLRASGRRGAPGVDMRAIQRYTGMAEAALLRMAEAVATTADSGADTKGARNEQKRELVIALACDFERAFGRKATATISGTFGTSPFMKTVEAVAAALGIAIGRDAVLAALRAKAAGLFAFDDAAQRNNATNRVE